MTDFSLSPARLSSPTLSDRSPNGKALFSTGGHDYGWPDVVALAKLRGEWDRLAAQVGAGAAALAELEAGGEPISEQELEAAAREFRYERDLLAGDELTGWLERQRIDVDEWEAFLRRELALARRPDAEGCGELPQEAEIWAEGICSGRLEQLARELARLAAVSPGDPLDRLDAAFRDFCDATVDEQAAAREVEANRLEWLRVRYQAIVAGDEGAAREAALCVRADGDPLPTVADRAGLGLVEDDTWLDELDPAVATVFLTAAPGELVGPVAAEDGFVVAQLISKTDPSLDDERVRERAREAAVNRAVSRLVTDRVVWL